LTRRIESRGAEADAAVLRSSGRSAAGARVAQIAGAVAVLIPALVPSAALVAALRGSAEPAAPELLAGAALFRIAVAALGLGAVLRFGGLGAVFGAPPPRAEAAAPPRRAEAGGASAAGFGFGLAAIVALGAALRLPGLDAGLWLDEVLTLVDHVRLPWGTLLTTYDTENQHFGFTLPAHFAVAAFGESAWALRTPALACGVASLAALGWIGRLAVDRREGLLAALLLAVSYHHVWFSQNARGYSGALCFVLIATGFFLRARDADTAGRAATRPWVGYAVAIALAAWSHLTAVFVALAHFALQAPRVFARGARPAARWLPFADGFALAALLAFALYAFAIPQLLALTETSTVSTWRDPVWMLRETLSGLGRGGLGGGALAGAGALVLVAIGAASYLRAGRPEIPVLFALPVALLAAAGLALGHHLWPRTFFVAAGFAVLLAVRGILATAERAAGLVGVRGRAARRLGTAGVLAAALVSAATVPRAWGPKQDYAGARDFVEAERSAGDAVVAVGLAAFPYRHLYAPDWRLADTAAELEAIRAEPGRTWVVYTFPQHMAEVHGDAMALLEREFEPVREFGASVGDGVVVVVRERAPGERED
jgi:hypothetical protein